MQREELAGEWGFVDGVWSGTDALVIARRDEWFSTWLMWSTGGGDFLGYYVNFERPWTRTAGGFDSHDLAVDLVVSPAGEPTWKDRDAFEQRIAVGIIEPDAATAVRDAMRAVEQQVDARAGVFAGDLVGWKPDPDWRVPVLPDD